VRRGEILKVFAEGYGATKGPKMQVFESRFLSCGVLAGERGRERRGEEKRAFRACRKQSLKGLPD